MAFDDTELKELPPVPKEGKRNSTWGIKVGYCSYKYINKLHPTLMKTKYVNKEVLIERGKMFEKRCDYKNAF